MKNLNLFGKGVQGLMPVALLFILGILLFPIPTILLDICLALNITLSLIILFVSLYIDKPLKFTAYPAILLVTTVFRLAMNVATTRLILLHGQEGTDAAGHVIQSFANFVIGGSFIVGIVIFVIISLVNLKVITKGSGRIAEVAARFTLDAMPGKQMAIDSDLNTGLINDVEAKARRKELQQEAEFYGAMDGAAKFVGGEAVAGIFIIGVNVIGGFLIGVLQHKLGWWEAAQIYTILTIGDGLVSQIPAIIVSVSAGLIVARAASGADLSTEFVSQLGTSPTPLFLAGGASFIFALLPGLPFLPFMALAAGGIGLGMLRQKVLKKEEDHGASGQLSLAGGKSKGALPEPHDPKKPAPGSTEEVLGLLGMDTLELEVGYELVALVEGGDLVERIRSLRRQFATDYGFIVPPIHIRDNVRINPGEYRLLLKGAVIGGSELKAHHLLAMDPGTVTSPIQGEQTREPAFGLDALWIPESEKERAQFSGYTVVDLSTVVTTHLTELVRTNMAELLGRQEVQALLDNVAKDHPKVVEELIPTQLSLGQVQQVLGHLLKEQISIRDLRSILETLADWAPNVKHPERLAEFVRRKLARQITAKYVNPDGMLALSSMTPALERTLSEAVQQTDEGSYLALDPAQAQVFINRLSKVVEKFMESGSTPILLAPSHLRAAVFRFVDRFVPGMAVISHYEIAPNTKVQSVGVVSLDDGQ